MNDYSEQNLDILFVAIATAVIITFLLSFGI